MIIKLVFERKINELVKMIKNVLPVKIINKSYIYGVYLFLEFYEYLLYFIFKP